MENEDYRDAVDCTKVNHINDAAKEEESIKFMDESQEQEDISMEPQRYESLRKGHSTSEEKDNISNEIIQYSGDEYALDRLTSVESGALRSESDCVDINNRVRCCGTCAREMRPILPMTTPSTSAVTDNLLHEVTTGRTTHSISGISYKLCTFENLGEFPQCVFCFDVNEH